MAMMLRDRNTLVALQPRLVSHAHGERLVCGLFQGAEEIGTAVDLPVAQLGLPDIVTEETLGDAILALPPALAEQVKAATGLLGGNGPLWIHIPRGAPKLALFPWEALVARLANVPLFRLPNFLEDPFEPGETLEIAVCLVPPPGRTDHELGAIFGQFLAALGRLAADQQAIITVNVFADAACEPEIARIAEASAAVHLSVVIHPAATAAEPPESPPGAYADRKLVSPWLRWMARRLQGKPIDLVHVIAPASFTQTRASLALTQMPLIERDRLWARGVGVDELAALLDRLGSCAVSFAPAAPGPSQAGLSLLAFELSWRRPGPVIAVQPDAAGAERLISAYRLICGERIPDTGLLRDTVFTCHPRYLLAGIARPESLSTRSMDGASSSAERDIARSLVYIAQGKGADESVLARTGRSAGEERRQAARSFAPPVPASQSERLVGTYIRKSQAALTGIERTSQCRQWEKEGAAKALELAQQLLSESRQRSGPDAR